MYKGRREGLRYPSGQNRKAMVTDGGLCDTGENYCNLACQTCMGLPPCSPLSPHGVSIQVLFMNFLYKL
jgi:hypothetical protein